MAGLGDSSKVNPANVSHPLGQKGQGPFNVFLDFLVDPIKGHSVEGGFGYTAVFCISVVQFQDVLELGQELGDGEEKGAH